MILFLQGLILGFSIAAPVGPIGVLCIRRTLSSGMLTGFISGIGTATADAFYGGIAAFGITEIAAFLVEKVVFMRLAGGVTLCYLGYKAAYAKTDVKEVQVKENGLTGAYFSALLITLTNPLTIFSFASVYAGVGLGQITSDYASAGILCKRHFHRVSNLVANT